MTRWPLASGGDIDHQSNHRTEKNNFFRVFCVSVQDSLRFFTSLKITTVYDDDKTGVRARANKVFEHENESGAVVSGQTANEIRHDARPNGNLMEWMALIMVEGEESGKVQMLVKVSVGCKTVPPTDALGDYQAATSATKRTTKMITSYV